MEGFDIIVIGGGAAGIAAARAAYEEGIRSIALIDSGESLGGVLLQCSHRGFGNELSGPEYIGELLRDFPKDIRFFPKSTVISIEKDKSLRLFGGKRLAFRQLILAAGGREIALGALPVRGTRPEGIFTAGQMQRMMNVYGFVPQSPVLILGGGDLGTIMAEQCARLGLKVILAEKEKELSAMARNRRRLEGLPVELYLSDSLLEVCGEKQLEGCILESGKYITCRSLLVAVGLLPEDILAEGFEKENWLHLCGNCSRIHPMVESVINEGREAGISACRNLRCSHD